jgi:SAM-dependent methyltransferase
MSSRSDAAWRAYGDRDPYYGVLSADRYRSANLDEAARREFFASGEAHVDRLLGILGALYGPVSPRRALDLGCGVGRIAIPFARRCGEVVGVDVAPGMLAEAARNCRDRGVSNVVLAPADDRLSAVSGTFDLIHSYIVFQHVAPRRGLALARLLLGRLDPGGIGALHFTHGRTASPARRALQRLRRAVPLVHRLANAVQRRPQDPPMEMNAYDLGQVLGALQDAGCDDVHVRFTDHAGHRGAFVLFRRRPLPAWF